MHITKFFLIIILVGPKRIRMYSQNQQNKNMLKKTSTFGFSILYTKIPHNKLHGILYLKEVLGVINYIVGMIT